VEFWPGNGGNWGNAGCPVGKAGSPDGGGVGVAATGSSEGGLDVD